MGASGYMLDISLIPQTMVEFAGVRLEPERIVGFLRQEMQLRPICQQMVYRQIIHLAAQERNLEVSPDEIQDAANQLRYSLRIERAADTLNWLSEQMMTVEDWEMGLRDRLLTQKLKESLFARDVERVFAESRLDFDRVDLYRLRVPYQPLCQELFYQIEEGEISFYEAAHLYDVDEQRRLRCGYEGRLHRWNFAPEVAAAIFGEAPGQVLGPFASNQGYDLLMSTHFLFAELNDETRNTILDRLFHEWLEGELNYLLHSQINST